MKARVKATGKIVELSDIEFDVYGNGYLRTGLEITDEPDYWEKLTHQYAGMAMQGILSNNELYRVICKSRNLETAIMEYATDLVNRLKEESQCKE